MKATNAMQTKPKGFSAIVNSDTYRTMINKSFSSPDRSAQFVQTLINVVNSNYKLAQCEPGSIITAALGGVGLGLSMNLGEFAVVPYGNRATFQLQVNGLKQLCIRSGKYEKMDFFDVRQGEYKGRDRMTREPIIEWIEDEDDREDLPIVGYYGFYKLKDSAGGMFKTIYWSHKQILKHADRYSKAFSLETYEKLIAGKLSAEQAAKLANSSPWYAEPNSTAHMKMCMKTIAKQLLGDGSAPKEVFQQIVMENEAERTGVAPIVDSDVFTAPTQPNLVADDYTVEDDAEDSAENGFTKSLEEVAENVAKSSQTAKKQAKTTTRKTTKKVEPTPEPEFVEAEIVESDEEDMSFFFD